MKNKIKEKDEEVFYYYVVEVVLRTKNFLILIIPHAK